MTGDELNRWLGKHSGKVGWALLLSFFAWAGISGHLSRKRKITGIKNSYSWAIGHFYRFENPSGGGYTGSCYYWFELGDSICYGETSGSNRYRRLKDEFYKFSYPVIYSISDPAKNEILIFPDDFEDYGIKYPDSLYWVKRLIE